MKYEDIPQIVATACHNRGYTSDQMEDMTGQQLFQELCEWEGLINWDQILWETVRQLSK